MDWLACLTVAILVLQVSILWRQAGISKKQNRISKEQNRISEEQNKVSNMIRMDQFRPAISCARPRPKDVEPGDNVKLIDLGPVVNHGKGGALEVKAELIWGTRRIGPSDLQDLRAGEGAVSDTEITVDPLIAHALAVESRSNSVLVLFRSRDVRGHPHYNWHVWEPTGDIGENMEPLWQRRRGGYVAFPCEIAEVKLEQWEQKELEPALRACLSGITRKPEIEHLST